MPEHEAALRDCGNPYCHNGRVYSGQVDIAEGYWSDCTQCKASDSWTPGPWCVYPHGEHVAAVWTGTDPETHGNPVAEVHRQRGGVGATDWLAGSAYMRTADAQLVALAPDMAEAILAMEAEATTPELRSLRYKLRAIGGDHA